MDVSRYTGMEMEHGHDTAGLLEQSSGHHLDTIAVDSFVENSRIANASTRKEALDHTITSKIGK